MPAKSPCVREYDRISAFICPSVAAAESAHPTVRADRANHRDDCEIEEYADDDGDDPGLDIRPLCNRDEVAATHHQQMDLARHPEKSKATHRQMRAKDRPLANDFVSDEEFDRLLRA